MTRRRTTTTRVVENALTGRSRPLKAVVCGSFGLRWCAIAVNSWWGREIFYGEDSAPIVLHLPPHHSCFTKAFMHHSKTIDQVQRPCCIMGLSNWMFIGVMIGSFVGNVFTGSCKEAALCCTGRDSACVVQKTSPNAIIQTLSDKPCYCDHACLKLGDCCHDFKDACGVLDCIVSGWGPWSSCDSECGPGSQSRSRMVVRNAENGGKHCPQLMQHRGCQGTKCHTRNPKSALKEVALLLPAELSEVRHINDTNDIRTNLRLQYRESPEYDSSKEYCVTFTVTKASKACYNDANLSEFAEGSRVCVRCQTQALRRVLDWRCEGDGGIEAMITRWSMLSSPHCHGKWLRTEKTGPECETSLCKPEAHFIFV